MDCDIKRRLPIEIPNQHQYRILNRSMADAFVVLGAWLALNGDYFEQIAGALLMMTGAGSRGRRRRRIRMAAAMAVCARRPPPPTAYIRYTGIAMLGAEWCGVLLLGLTPSICPSTHTLFVSTDVALTPLWWARTCGIA